jgi:Cu/Zn superoxide dismutase
MNLKKMLTVFVAATSLSLAIVPVFVTATAQTVQTSASVETVLNFAKLSSVAAPTQGTVVIVKKTDGSSVLRLQNLKTEAGPDLHVYLYGAVVPGKNDTSKTVKAAKFLDLGKLGAPFTGFFEYKIPEGTDLAAYKSAIIWCDLVGTTFAGASLN